MTVDDLIQKLEEEADRRGEDARVRLMESDRAPKVCAKDKEIWLE